MAALATILTLLTVSAIGERATNQGVDTILGTKNCALPVNVENLTLLRAAPNGTGNTLANVIIGNVNSNTLLGLAGNDLLDGRARNDTLDGGAGNDRVDGGVGNDRMDGGAGSDIYTVDSTADVVMEAPNEGTDAIRSTVTRTLSANVENLTLLGAAAINGTGNTLANTIVGNAAANRLDGMAGADRLLGLRGNDTYFVDQTGDVVTEFVGEGIDTIRSTVSRTLPGNVENLLLTAAAFRGSGNGLANTITGNSANNVLIGMAGGDTMIGAGGDDTYVIDDTGDRVIEAANGGNDRVLTSITYSLALKAQIEHVSAIGTDAINLTGNSSKNIVIGNSGANILTGLANDDMLSGGDGDDTIIGGGGKDVVRGGAGNDILLLTKNSKGLMRGETYDGGDGFDTLDGQGTSHASFTGVSWVGLEELRGFGRATLTATQLNSIERASVTSIRTTIDGNWVIGAPLGSYNLFLDLSDAGNELTVHGSPTSGVFEVNGGDGNDTMVFENPVTLR